jgi:hypothetical protein
VQAEENMRSARSAPLTVALTGARASWDKVTDCRSLAGGTFNAVYLVDVAMAPGS